MTETENPATDPDDLAAFIARLESDELARMNEAVQVEKAKRDDPVAGIGSPSNGEARELVLKKFGYAPSY